MEVSESLLREGACDFVGYGRLWLAYPQFYNDYLNGAFHDKKCCVTCSKCTELMRAKCVSGCAVFDDYYKNLYEEKIVCKR
jgi:2,4-dienoyl-CoA reductase-like NADH-dependent reductase (Old Yellow Enzyme family)